LAARRWLAPSPGRLKDIAIAAFFSKCTASLLGTFFKIFAFLNRMKSLNFEDPRRLRYRVQLRSAGSYLADAERPSISAFRSYN
jgi:hypothetical protein